MREFPPFRLDTVNQCLWRGEGPAEERILLAPKAFAVLRYLVEHPGRLVAHPELAVGLDGSSEGLATSPPDGVACGPAPALEILRSWAGTGTHRPSCSPGCEPYLHFVRRSRHLGRRLGRWGRPAGSFRSDSGGVGVA